MKNTSAVIAHANQVWAKSRRCTGYAFAVGCVEKVNGVSVYREHGAICAFGWRTSDGTRAESCFSTVAKARQYARRRR